ncbi:hypothetical protein ACFXB3_09455 [Streptomyces sp. NPDC059447]|uniref:hypothetical protein n=1 Tax=Streptomyces sp. NPDC059447 TaxID=3346834 RepID=UPI0036CDDDB6
MRSRRWTTVLMWTGNASRAFVRSSRREVGAAAGVMVERRAERLADVAAQVDPVAEEYADDPEVGRRGSAPLAS